MPTRRFSSSLVRIGSALAFVLVLAACTAGGQFDPTEVVSSDIFNTKKKIAGDREPLFPQRRAGRGTGVPPDLVKGYQPPPEAPALADNAAPEPQPAAPARRNRSQSPNRSRRSRAVPAPPADMIRLGIGTARRPRRQPRSPPWPLAAIRRSNQLAGLRRPTAQAAPRRRKRTGRLRRRPGKRK